MSRADNEIRIVPSVLDRLLDYEPERSRESIVSRSRNLRHLKQSVRRDIEWLRFRTCYPAILWPIEVASASFESNAPLDSRNEWKEAFINISLDCPDDTPFCELKVGDEKAVRPIDSLRFFIDGDPQLACYLYEVIFNRAVRIELRGEIRREGAASPVETCSIELPASCLRPVGFSAEEGMLPYTARSFMGYRLLTEYFSFPEKFLFFDVTGVDKAAQLGFKSLEILIHVAGVAPPGSQVDAGTFKLGCAPIVNLFSKIAEPILLTPAVPQRRAQVI